MGIVALDHVQIGIPRGGDEDARAFYGGLLGLKEIAKPRELAGRGGLWFAIGGQELHLGVEDEFRPARKAHPAFVVRDVDGLRRALAAAGGATTDDMALPDRRRFHATDPFGNRLEFLERVSTYGSAAHEGDRPPVARSA